MCPVCLQNQQVMVRILAVDWDETEGPGPEGRVAWEIEGGNPREMEGGWV